MKRLIVCFDGTWNDAASGEALTNVAKLSRAIIEQDRRGVIQKVKYIAGVGTGYGGALGRGIGASGIEVGARVQEGYKFLAANYEPGDEIYVYGFSRGAFQARSLAGLIAFVGLMNPNAGISVGDAWQVYRAGRDGADPAALRKVRQASDYPVPVKLVGVWDTVGNIGNPLWEGGRLAERFKFHDTRLSPTVEVGLHALSIDEQRGPFRPALWTRRAHEPLPEHQRVEQVWFSGVHADVGGGYEETALSDIALLWMAERTAAYTNLAINVEKLMRFSRADPLGVQHSSTANGVFKASALLPFVRLIGQNRKGSSAVRRLFFRDIRTVRIAKGEVTVNELIHPSARARFGKAVKQNAGGKIRSFVYRPRNLAASLQPNAE